MPNHASINDHPAMASLFAEHEAAMRRIGLLHRVRRVLLAVAAALAAVAAWAALQAPPATPTPTPQPTVTTAAPCPPRPPATTPAGGYVPQTANAYDPEDC